MGQFATVHDLAEFLVQISPRYSKYAEALWANDIRSQRELASTAIVTLVQAGIEHEAHAQTVHAYVNPKGGMLQQNWTGVDCAIGWHDMGSKL